MKTLSTISLFIFGIVLTSLLTAGLVFYQNNKTGNNGNNGSGSQTGALVQGTISNITANGKSITLNLAEISKHNNSSDCWMLISGNVYDITPFFGSHPGGNATMAATCGTDATDAYATKDPNATSTAGGRDHSANAKNMLADYYIGTLNQVLGSSAKTGAGTSASKSNSSTNNPIKKSPTTNPVVNPVVSPVGNITLSMAEIAKHNSASDCFMLISGKVYNITPFFGSHPGGNAVMAATCGTDATDAYLTKDPNATSATGGRSHSANAQSMLVSYFIGNLNQTIGQQAVQQTTTVPPPATRGGENDD